jgi:CelD/BcsL family acetyltransferase involved in cellulose biosynthesis
LSHDVSLPGANAFVASDTRDLPFGAPARPNERERRHAADGISVEIASGARLAEIRADWLDLLGRADAPNVFMNPTLVRLAGESFAGTPCRALLAWRDLGDAQQLVGIWGFAVGRPRRSILPVSVLIAPPSAHAYLGTPVIDRDFLDATLTALLAHVASEPGLPKIIALESMGADGLTMQALTRALAARGSTPFVFGQTRRPTLQSDLDGKQYLEKALSSSSRKKLRQHRRRLAERGALEFRIAAEPDAVRQAFEEFLTLEASGWKGKQGTALSSHEADAAFARAMVGTLASHGDASVHALYLDGRPVSMQIVLRAGPAAFTWKTAYDEAFHHVSPGALLLEDYTAAFLADKSIAFVDSCAFDESSFMATWSERQTIADIWIDVRRGSSLTFTMLTRMQKAYLTLRDAAKRLYRDHIERRLAKT